MCLVELFPHRRELFAMAAPWRVKLDKPREARYELSRFRVHNQGVEIGRV